MIQLYIEKGRMGDSFETIKDWTDNSDIIGVKGEEGEGKERVMKSSNIDCRHSISRNSISHRNNSTSSSSWK